MSIFRPVNHIFTRIFPKVMFLEEMTADPMGALSDVFSFLGLDLLEEEGGKKVRSVG